jgi:hypothetical protein
MASVSAWPARAKRQLLSSAFRGGIGKLPALLDRLLGHILRFLTPLLQLRLGVFGCVLRLVDQFIDCGFAFSIPRSAASFASFAFASTVCRPPPPFA